MCVCMNTGMRIDTYIVPLYILTTSKDYHPIVLHHNQTMVLLIVNQTIGKKLLNLELQHIVTGVIFCRNKPDGMLIDFLCACRGYHGYGYGYSTLLQHKI